MIPRHGIMYAVHLITNHFGDLVAKVCECLLRNGPLPLHAIARRTELPPTKVKNSLLVLIQHNCVQAFSLDEAEDGGEPGKIYLQYMALFTNILHRARFSKFMDVVSKELGGPCVELLKGLLEHGRLTVKQILDRKAEENAKESTKTVGIGPNAVQENLHKLVMSHYVESCPVSEPVVPSQADDPAAKRRAAKSEKVIVETVTLEQRVMSAAMPSEVKRFLFAPNTDKITDNEQKMDQSPSKDVGKKRKLGDMESDTAVAEEDEIMWRANFEELARRLRHKVCIDTTKARLDDEAATVLSAMIEGSRTEEKKVKTASSVPMSLNSIYEEVMKNERNHSMTFDHVRTCLHQMRSSPAFVKGADEYSIDFAQIIEAAQSEDVETLILKRYGRDAYIMFRLLSRAGCLMESDKIAHTVFIDTKGATNTLYRMWEDGYLIMQKLVLGGSAGANGYGGSTCLLWKVNKKNLLETVLDEMFHAALNLNLRAAHELDLNKEVLNMPAEKRQGADKEKFDQIRSARLLINSSLMKIDDAIMLFHDF